MSHRLGDLEDSMDTLLGAEYVSHRIGDLEVVGVSSNV